LIKRINACCAEQEMDIHEFVTDAIIEKIRTWLQRETKKGQNVASINIEILLT
jgi:hypothetical protein